MPDTPEILPPGPPQTPEEAAASRRQPGAARVRKGVLAEALDKLRGRLSADRDFEIAWALSALETTGDPAPRSRRLGPHFGTQLSLMRPGTEQSLDVELLQLPEAGEAAFDLYLLVIDYGDDKLGELMGLARDFEGHARAASRLGWSDIDEGALLTVEDALDGRGSRHFHDRAMSRLKDAEGLNFMGSVGAQFTAAEARTWGRRRFGGFGPGLFTMTLEYREGPGGGSVHLVALGFKEHDELFDHNESVEAWTYRTGEAT